VLLASDVEQRGKLTTESVAMARKLSSVQARHFKDAGFLRLSSIVPQNLVAKAREQLVVDLNDPTGPCYRNQAGKAYKLYGLLERGGPYKEVIQLDSILQILSDLIGPDVVYTRNRHNHASLNRAGDNSEGLHRDVLKAGLVTVIVYLDDVTLENGPTMLIPGSHQWPYAPARTGGIYLDQIDDPEYRELSDQAVPILAKSGDVLAFESTVFHTAMKNISSGTRGSLVLAYRAVDELTGVAEGPEHLAIGDDIYRGNIVMPEKQIFRI
jgi:hypothetical protein